MANQTPAAPLNPTLPGTVLAGKYKVERIIGQGGMGVVVEARHITLDERVALKFLLPEYASHPEASGRFLREARAAVKIKSEHVARVSDVGTLDTGAPYMVMEFLEGDDLSRLLEKQGVLQIPDAIDYVVQGCEALAEAHGHGIVHRDLKPANLFLTKRSNGTPLVKVLDFGISKMSGAGVDNLTKTTTAMGSALYMSPEQMQATRGVDHRTDIYALGVTLYELLAGKQPFYADTLPQLCAAVFTGVPTPIRESRPDVPPELAAVMEKAYARDRAHRYQSVAELVVALAPFAPPRSRPTIEGVAHMGGISANAIAPSGVHAAPMPSAPNLNAAALGSTVAVPGMADGRASSAPVIGAAPVLSGSASMVSVMSPAPVTKSKAPVVVLALVGLLALGGAGAAVVLRGNKPPVVATQPPAETAVTQPVNTATTAPPPVTATATATAAAEVAPTATASVAAVPGPLPKPLPGGAGKVPAAAKTAAAAATEKPVGPAVPKKKPDDVGF